MAVFGMSKFKFQVQSQANHRLGRGIYPRSSAYEFTQTCQVRRSGDQSLFPTCDFLLFGDLLHLGASQEWNQNGHTPAPFVGGPGPPDGGLSIFDETFDRAFPAFKIENTNLYFVSRRSDILRVSPH